MFFLKIMILRQIVFSFMPVFIMTGGKNTIIIEKSKVKSKK